MRTYRSRPRQHSRGNLRAPRLELLLVAAFCGLFGHALYAQATSPESLSERFQKLTESMARTQAQLQQSQQQLDEMRQQLSVLQRQMEQAGPTVAAPISPNAMAGTAASSSREAQTPSPEAAAI